MTWETGGNVGIGTSDPASFLANATALEIAGGNNLGSELILTNTSSMAANEHVGSLIFKNQDPSGNPNHFAGLRAKAEAQYGRMYLEFYAGRSRMEDNAPDMVISPRGADAQGNVGIANTSPSEKLAVHGGIQASNTGNFSSGNAGIYLDYNPSTEDTPPRVRPGSGLDRMLAQTPVPDTNLIAPLTHCAHMNTASPFQMFHRL